MFRILLLPLLLLGSAYSQGLISTIAGTDFRLRDARPATEVPLGGIGDVEADTSGNLFVSDYSNHIVVKIAPDGILSIYAGNQIAAVSGDGGPARNASLSAPGGMALDRAGNLYVVNGRDRIRMVKPDGTIVTVAGGGTPADGLGDGGPATQASLNNPYGVAVDGAGNLYIADTDHLRVRKVTPDGVIRTIVANVYVQSVAVDSKGNVYFTDSSQVRWVGPAGAVQTLADASATFLALDAQDNLYLLGPNLQRRNADGSLTTLAGNGVEGFLGDGGPATAASLYRPSGVAFGPRGEIYIADQLNRRVRRVTPDGTITTVVGNGQYRYAGDGAAATSAVFYAPKAVVADAAGNVYVADYNNNRVRKITPDGIIGTVAGNGELGFSGDGGPATEARLNRPSGLALDGAGNLYINDYINTIIRKVTPDGIISTLPIRSHPPARPLAAIAADADGNLYVADTERVWKLTPEGDISLVAGTGKMGFSGDGGPATDADLIAWSIAVDANGNIYIAGADTSPESGLRVRQITPDGTIQTVAGNGNGTDCGDGGPAVDACLSRAYMAADSGGNLYISGSNRIRRITPDGIIDAIAGTGISGFSGDGGPATSARLAAPADVAVDPAGNIYIADTGNNRIRAILANPPEVSVPSQSLAFSARSGSAVPTAQTLSVNSSVPGLEFIVDASTADGANWLRAAATSSTLPASLQVTVDPTGLAAGNYQGSVTITAPRARQSSQSVPVSFIVTAANPPKLGFAPGNLSFSFTGASAPAAQTLLVSNRGDGSLAFTAQVSGGSWLSLSAQSGAATATTPASLTATANPAGLGAGTYNASVQLRSSTTHESLEAPVTLTIAARGSLRLSQTGLSFQAVAGPGAGDVAQTFAVLNAGSGVMSWTATAATQSGGNWIVLRPAGGATDGASLQIPQVTVEPNAAGLAPGKYQGAIQVSAPGADNSPQSVQVFLEVLPPTGNPRPIVLRTGLVFAGPAGAVSPGSQQTGIVNYRPSPLDFTSFHGTYDKGNWFAMLPTDATIDGRKTEYITVQPDVTGLSPGIYNGAITVMYKEFDPRLIQVLLVVAPAGTGKQAAGGRPASASCSPTALRAVFTRLANGFTAQAGQPAPLEIQAVDDCGQPLTAGSVLATFSNDDVALSLVSLKDGRWTGTWFPKNAAPAGVTIRIHAQSAGLGYDTSVDGGIGVAP